MYKQTKIRPRDARVGLQYTVPCTEPKNAVRVTILHVRISIIPTLHVIVMLINAVSCTLSLRRYEPL